jgi:hypothetical protein
MTILRSGLFHGLFFFENLQLHVGVIFKEAGNAQPNFINLLIENP